MNILITGGTGLIGRALIESLLGKPVEITVLTRNIPAAQNTFPMKVNLIDKLTLGVIEEQDIIINLAGEPIAEKRWSSQQKNKICQSRWLITEQLSHLITQAKSAPSLFISSSAVGIYGRQSQTNIDENFTNYSDEFTHKVCSTWEKIALNTQSANTRIAILRTGIVLSNKGGALPKMLLPFKLGLGGKIATGQQIMSWIHIDDMVAAILHIMKTNTLQGVINMTSANPVSNKVFSIALSQSLNRPSFMTTPSFMLKIIFGEMADLMLFGQHVIPNKLLNSKFSFRFSTIENALNDLIAHK